ncbi:MAG TPA: histidine kinase dimerization/phosphoacceptor domain -containing protein [Methanobacteriaceae archaeon]|nr:histidine kinase dimerization/phosphoacceptor domain -containing protein [Methanobacteriaceae archaeon]
MFSNHNQGFLSTKTASYISLIIILTITIILLLLRDNLNLRVFANNSFKITIDILVIFILFYATKNLVQKNSNGNKKNLKRFWILLTLTLVCYAVADVFLMLFYVYDNTAMVLAADFFYLLTYPLFVSGLLIFPGLKINPFNRSKMFLDLGIFLVLLAIFSWTFIISPEIQGHPKLLFTTIFGLIFAVLYLFSLAILVHLIFNQTQKMVPAPLPFIGLAILTLLITDIIFIDQTVRATYSPGGILEVGWMLGILFLGLSGVTQLNQETYQFPHFFSRLTPIFQKYRFDIYLPLLWLFSALLLLLWSVYYPSNVNMYLIGFGVALVVVLSFARQMLSVQENRHLFLSAQEEISRRKEVEINLQESENMYRAIFQNTGTGNLILDENHNIFMANREFERLSGFSREEVEGKKNFKEFLTAPDENFPFLKKRNVDFTPHSCQFTLQDRDGKFKDIFLIHSKVKDTNKSVLSLIDVTDRKNYEKRIKASLEEKEVLLREVHHRVKNNMQVISSLLTLQSIHIDDPEVAEVLKESKIRVRSMAMVHESLYQSQNMASVDFKDYIQKLSSYIYNTYKLPPEIKFNTKIDPLKINIDTAVPCGLIINELMTNCLKHAFSDGRTTGNIDIELFEENGRIKVVVGDDGVGFPPHLDLDNLNSLGLQLVRTLVQQIQGQINIDSNPGVKFTISFSPKKTDEI